MTREIKFRVWHQNKMITEIIGFEDGTVTGISSRDILMQYTGLKDKNGVEIYEGDLFGIFGGDEEKPNEYEIHGQIKFDTDFAMFIIELTNGGWMQLFDYMNNKSRAREVIGNIYQHPELLKK